LYICIDDVFTFMNITHANNYYRESCTEEESCRLISDDVSDLLLHMYLNDIKRDIFNVPFLCSKYSDLYLAVEARVFDVILFITEVT
jgi:hypothetical protein